MQSDSKISSLTITMPEGGGNLKGIGESFQPNLFDGSASFSIPIPTTPCRDFYPKLNLIYNSNKNNDVFGLGFSLSIPNISRKTEKGIPRYDDFSEDTFLLSNSEDLVPCLIEKDGKWLVEENITTLDGHTYSVKKYRPRIEGVFAKIEKWKNLESSCIHWEVITKDNLRNIYGKTQQAKIVDPQNGLKVFKWLLEESCDAKGNKIYYEYKQENDKGCSGDLAEVNRQHTANRYLKKIKYGNYFDEAGNESFAFYVIFDYGEHDPDNSPYLETKEWDKREDSFSSYRSGFEIRTHRLCKRILVFHQFKELGEEPCLVRAVVFEYEETSSISYLKSIKKIGYRKTDQAYETSEIPPLEFNYSECHISAQNFKPLNLENGKSIPGLINQAQYNMIDLYGEGIPGVLYNDEKNILYWKGRGEGDFEGPITIRHFPNERQSINVSYSLQDLEKEGRLCLVVNDPERPGFYEMNYEGIWENFRSFESFPLIAPDKKTYQLDVNGDGLTDIFMADNDSLSFHLSKGKNGYDSLVSLLREVDEDHLPLINNTSEEELFCFADIFGDGLRHPIRIRNGIIECWPNMGYGRFGKKITLKNAPKIEGKLAASRLYLADIDGSGTTDIIYLYHDKIEAYLNQNGNGFSEPQTIPLYAPVDNLDQINFADLLGNGTTCMVISRQPEGQSAVRHEYYDFTGGEKPGLIIDVVNNLGASTSITYASSTKFYLEDEKNGTPWATKLPFPVQVVEKTVVKDLISGSSLTTTYKYHHGYYDTKEREFRGFGLVEQWDAESFQENQEQEEEIESVPPVYTKTWHHTGAFIMKGILSKQFAGEYYNKDKKAHHLPDSHIDARGETIDAESVCEAYRAMKGIVLRHEVYAEDGLEGISEHSYMVSETNVAIRLVQPKGENNHAVFMVVPEESLTFHYERDPNDPRIAHHFMLEVDEYGNILKECDLVYSRREGANPVIYPEQQKIRATAIVNKFINITEDFYLPAVPYESKSFEIGGLEPHETDYFTLEEIRAYIDEALEEENSLGNEELLNHENLQSRLLTWTRSYFWDQTQENALALGMITEQALLHHKESAQFSETQAISLYGEKVEDVTLLMEEAGYHLKEGYWWNPGLIQYYGSAESFYLPTYTEDAFGYQTQAAYDDYYLVIIQTKDELGNTVCAEPDYITLQIRQKTDPNNNISEVLFDPLGMVTAVSVYGTVDGDMKGDAPLTEYVSENVGCLEDILNNPQAYLQKASTYFYYDYDAWQKRGEAPYFISIKRLTHASELKEGQETEVQIDLGYSDGFGRVLQQKIKVDPGPAWARNEDGSLKYQDGELVKAEVEDRWLSSGRTIYNNKEKPVKQYEPFFSSTAHYESEKEVVEYGVSNILHYDPLLRVIKTDFPKGFFSKVEFTPWEIKTYDENDTVKDSAYYQETITSEDQTLQDEITALEKAAEHYDTPEIAILDNLGREFIKIADRGDLTELTTHSELDILGNPLSITDPRQYELNKSRDNEEKVYNFQYIYDMAEEKVHTNSIDAGERLVLNNVVGNPVHAWNSREYHFKNSYDELHRPIEIRVEGNGLDHTVQRMEYGEGTASAADKNLNGQMIRLYDQAGCVENLLFDFKGQLLQSTRQLTSAYKEEVNWEDPNSVGLEEEIFETRTVYDAVGRIIEKTEPDGSLIMPSYHPAGMLNSVKVTLQGEASTFVESIEYDAKAQRQKITYGNGVITQYTYEETTCRLMKLQTSRESDGKILQDITYTYDPVGNIIKISDSSHEKVFTANQEVAADCQFLYDALYQLKSATGREHLALSKTDYQNKGDVFKSTHFAHINDAHQLRNYMRQYSYDTAGNLEQIKHIGENSFTRNITVSETSNRAVTDEMDTGNNPEDYFDAHGNMRELEHLAAIHWNYQDNIASVDMIERDSENDSEYYIYEGGGRRIRKVKETYNSNGELLQKEEKIYLGGIEIKRIKTGTSQTLTEERYALHVMDDQKRIAIVYYWTESNSAHIATGQYKIHYQLGNHLSSASLELNDAGEIISYEEYFPFGGTAFTSGSNAAEVKLKEYRYTGKERDDTTGLYYYGARYYAPWMGRWLNPDPGGPADGLNLYLYVSNNPTRKKDIKGTQELDVINLGLFETLEELHTPSTFLALDPTKHDILAIVEALEEVSEIRFHLDEIDLDVLYKQVEEISEYIAEHGTENIGEFVNEGNKNFTAWEFYEVMADEELLEKVKFYKGGERIKNDEVRRIIKDYEHLSSASSVGKARKISESSSHLAPRRAGSTKATKARTSGGILKSLKSLGPSVVTVGVSILLEYNTAKALDIIYSGKIPTEEEKELVGLIGYEYEGGFGRPEDRWIYRPSLQQGMRNALIYLLDPALFHDYEPPEIKEGECIPPYCI